MNLETKYLGLNLKNPLVVASSPLSEKLETMQQLEGAGASAIIMHSLFEEQVINETDSLEHYLELGTESFAEALSYFPQPKHFYSGPDQYLEHIRAAKKELKIPVIASLNGITTGGWIQYAKQVELAGADALELNIYFISANPELTGDQVENQYIDIVRAVRSEVKIPLSVKVGPYFSSIANMAKRFQAAGVQGLVLFNRFYEPDYDLERLEIEPKLIASSSHEMRLPLHWIAILSDRVKMDYALTSGVHTYSDVIKAMMAGANVVQMASELLTRGPHRITEILNEVRSWMESKEYESIQQLRGDLSESRVSNPTAYLRANYMKELQSFQGEIKTSLWGEEQSRNMH